MTAVLDSKGALAGVFTDGDLRRLLERVGDIRPLMVADVMQLRPSRRRSRRSRDCLRS